MQKNLHDATAKASAREKEDGWVNGGWRNINEEHSPERAHFESLEEIIDESKKRDQREQKCERTQFESEQFCGVL
jgi:hypothetical protein